MSDLTWEEPPDDRRGGGRSGLYDKHRRIVAELKANPGQWAKVGTEVSGSYASNLKRGLLKAYDPPSDFEFASRNHRQIDGASRCDVYIRYVGKKKK